MDANNFSKHQVSKKDCEECIAGYPTLCKCGGYIHAEYGVVEEKGRFVNTGPFLNCDKCGNKFMKNNNNFRRKGRAHHYPRANKSHEPARGSNARV